MAIEIERKFLVKNDDWRFDAHGVPLQGVRYCQGYVPTDTAVATVRVRIEGDQAKLTLKGKSRGLSRLEFEYPIPLEEAESMLEQFCGQSRVEKFRYKREEQGMLWEIDDFLGAKS